MRCSRASSPRRSHKPDQRRTHNAMTIQLSTTVRNAMLDAIETAIGISAVIKLKTGAQPANCAAADSGTVVATISLASDWMAAASSGAKSFSSTPLEDTSADN